MTSDDGYSSSCDDDVDDRLCVFMLSNGSWLSLYKEAAIDGEVLS